MYFNLLSVRLLTSILYFSWTVIAWIVIVGSSLVLIIWIAIYSVFNSIDFNDEVVVLYGEVVFWASVILTVVIALGECTKCCPS